MILEEKSWTWRNCGNFPSAGQQWMDVISPSNVHLGGLKHARKNYSFKNFYSIILMSMVYAKYRFIWGICGFPGIKQSTDLWDKIQGGNFLPNFSQIDQNVSIYPIVLGDSAFPFETWLMKPFTNAVLSPKQRYFTYGLSRARMIVEGAYGQLKGCWRYLMRNQKVTHLKQKLQH